MNWPKPLRFLWSAWALFWLLALTIPVASLVILAAALGFSRQSIQKLARFWARALSYGVGCPVSISGLENLEPGAPYVFACNHSSALDIPALSAVLPDNCCWVAKKELFSVPIFGPSLKAAGYIAIDRGEHRKAVQSILAAVERIKGGASVVIFPEGTRSVDGQLLPFKSGGFMLALRSGCPVVPVGVLGSNRALKPNKLLLNPCGIRVVVGRPIPSRGRGAGEREALAGQVRQAVQDLLDQHAAGRG